MKKNAIALLITGSLCWSTVLAQKDNLMLKHGLSLVRTPYVAHTLERTVQEELFTNRSELDCTTFVESAMAMSLSTKEDGTFSESDFARNLRKIRYRKGILSGYTSRLHYVTDWINDNIEKGIIEDVTARHSKDTNIIRLSFMSQNPDKYKHLKNNPENVARMSEIEKQLTGQEVHWVPKEKIPNEGFFWIKDGDIIMLTTNIRGLDVSHMGLAIYQNGKLHLLHASSVEKKVIIDKRTLRNQLAQSKHVTGIRVLRELRIEN